MPGTKMMGYKKGGDVKKKDMKKKGKAPGKTRKLAKGKSLKELGMTPSGPSKNPKVNPAMAAKAAAMNNTSAPKPPTPPQAAMGGAAHGWYGLVLLSLQWAVWAVLRVVWAL